MSPSEVRTSLDALGTHAKKLNRMTDEANETVRLVEQFLEDCSLGLVVSIHCESLDEGDESGPIGSTFLEYRRIPNHGKFRLAVIEKADNGTVVSARPWSKCARQRKRAPCRTCPFSSAKWTRKPGRW